MRGACDDTPEIDDQPLRIGQPETAIGNLRTKQLQPKTQQPALLLHAAFPQDWKPLRGSQGRRQHQRSGSAL